MKTIITEQTVYQANTEFGLIQIPFPIWDKEPDFNFNITPEYHLELFYTARCSNEMEKIKVVYTSPVVEHLKNRSLFQADEIEPSSEVWLLADYEILKMYLVNLRIQAGEYEKSCKHIVSAISPDDALKTAIRNEAHNDELYEQDGWTFENDDSFAYHEIKTTEITDVYEKLILAKYL